MNDSGVYPEWKMPERKGPTLDPKNPKVNIAALQGGWLKDERTEDEIQQEKFDNWQQMYEIEGETDAGRDCE